MKTEESLSSDGARESSRGPAVHPAQPRSSSSSSQKLGDRNFTIDTARIDGRHAAVSPVVKALKATTMIVLSPVALFVGSIATAFMLLSPNSLKNRIVSFWTPLICDKLDGMFVPERKELLKDCRGCILDIGSGGGAYLRYFKEASEIVALEPNSELHETIRREAKSQRIAADRLTILAMDTESYLEHNTKDARGKFDWVILGNVLCEIEDHASTLQAVDRMLRPGGMLYFSEHIGCPRGTWRRLLQELLNPFWRVLSHGCNIHRDSLLEIQSMPNWEVISWTYHNLRIGLGPFVIGLAQKRK